MNLTLKIWRQAGPKSKGEMVTYPVTDISEDMSFLEMLDVLNEQLNARGEEPVAFDSESAPAAKIDLAHWQRMIDVNLTGAFLSAKAALPDITRGDAKPGESSSSPPPRASRAMPTWRPIARPRRRGRARPRAGGGAGAARSDGQRRMPGFTQTPLLEASLANIAATTGRSRARGVGPHLERLNPRAASSTARGGGRRCCGCARRQPQSITGQPSRYREAKFDRPASPESQARAGEQSRSCGYGCVCSAPRAPSRPSCARACASSRHDAAQVRRHGALARKGAGMTMTSFPAS